MTRSICRNLYGNLMFNLLVVATIFSSAPQQDSSMLTFESNQVQGGAAIVAKYKSVGPVQHTVKSMDVQPSNNPNAIVIFVTGSIKIGGDNPLHFCEFFQLVSTAPGQYYVHNDIFRLNYGL